MTGDEYEAHAVIFEQAILGAGLVIHRRYPGSFGYEYRLALPGEPRDGSWYIYCLDESLGRYSDWPQEMFGLHAAWIEAQLQKKRIAA